MVLVIHFALSIRKINWKNVSLILDLDDNSLLTRYLCRINSSMLISSSVTRFTIPEISGFISEEDSFIPSTSNQETKMERCKTLNKGKQQRNKDPEIQSNHGEWNKYK